MGGSFCYLAMHKGEWAGKRVVPAAHYDFAWKGTKANPNYGAQWWLAGRFKAAGAPDDFVATLGAFNNDGFVVPGLDLVVVRLGDSRKFPKDFERRLVAKVLAAVMAKVVRERGAPAHIRSDNGPEFIARAVRDWMSGAGVETLYIEPGSPWENGYAESFNSKVRDELLNVEEFASLLEAQVLGKAWKQEYNHARPHSSLGYRTPAEFGETCPRAGSAALDRPGDTSVAVDSTLTPPGT